MTGDKENRCKFEGYGRTCRREREPDSEFCICHLKEAGKDPEKFWAEVSKVLNDKSSGQFDFAGFFFIPWKRRNIIRLLGATFPQDANFGGATFFGIADFNGAKFSGIADFNGAKFSEDAYFRGAKFSRDAYFFDATFSKDTDFGITTFFRGAYFLGTTFFKTVNFSSVTFENGVDFSKSKFLQNIEFIGAEFKGKTRFQESKFKDSSNFRGAEFNELYFKEASFDGELNFSDIFIESYAKFTKTKFHSETYFRECDFEKPERVSFNGVNLDKISFKNTDLSRVYFVNCEWAEVYRRPEPLKKIFGKGGSRRGIYDEILLKKKPEDIKYSDVETLYRQLKYNYEETRNYPDAGDFYIGEMEMRRKKGAPMLHLYKILSMYGENYWLPPVWILFVVVFFGIVFLLLGFEYNSTTIDYSIGWNNPFSISILQDFLLSCIYVFKAITLQSVGISPVKGSIVSEFIQAILKPIGVVLFTLGALALRRRFRR